MHITFTVKHLFMHKLLQSHIFRCSLPSDSVYYFAEFHYVDSQYVWIISEYFPRSPPTLSSFFLSLLLFPPFFSSSPCFSPSSLRAVKGQQFHTLKRTIQSQEQHYTISFQKASEHWNGILVHSPISEAPSPPELGVSSVVS